MREFILQHLGIYQLGSGFICQHLLFLLKSFEFLRLVLSILSPSSQAILSKYTLLWRAFPRVGPKASYLPPTMLCSPKGFISYLNSLKFLLLLAPGMLQELNLAAISQELKLRNLRITLYVKIQFLLFWPTVLWGLPPFRLHCAWGLQSLRGWVIYSHNH